LKKRKKKTVFRENFRNKQFKKYSLNISKGLFIVFLIKIVSAELLGGGLNDGGSIDI
jgi:hypothetical protein